MQPHIMVSDNGYRTGKLKYFLKYFPHSPCAPAEHREGA